MENMIFLAIGAVAVGVFVGVFSGMLGIGGGTVLVPVFRLVFGLDALGATGTSLFTIIPTSISGAATHIRKKTCVPAVGLAAGIGGACTSWIGVLAASASPDWCVMLAAAAVIGYSAYSMFKKAMKLKPKPKDAVDTVAAPADQVPEVAVDRSLIMKGAAIGLLAGVLSGYVGVGGGFIMVPLFLSVLGLPMKKASGTSLISVVILCIPAVVMQFMLGNVDLLVGLAVVVGSVPGATVGARLQSRVPERALRFMFAGFLVLAAIMLVVKEAGLLG